MKKFLPYILILVIITGLFSKVTPAEAVICTGVNVPAGCTPDPNYHLLAPLPCELGKDGTGCVPVDGKGQLKAFDPTQPGNLGAYLNLMIKIFIGICAVLSVVMIVMGGVEYMTSELSHTKEAGKEKIEHALLGLVIALGAYALLFTINPDLLKSDFNPPKATVYVATGYCEGRPDLTTQQDCYRNDEPWIEYRGICVFKIASSGIVSSAETTKAGCDMNGNNFISWTKI